MQQKERKRLTILTNILPPYRVPVYRLLGEHFDTVVMLSGEEDNRHWDLKHTFFGFSVTTVKGLTVRRSLSRGSGRTYDLKYTHVTPRYLWELIKYRPDAIITTEMGFRSLLGLVYGALRRVPVWVWWGGTLHTERHRSRTKRLLRRLVFARTVRRWISYGDTSTAYLRSLRIPADRILQIQNCVDDQLYTVKSEPYPLDLPRPRALLVGQLIGRKGISELLNVTARVQRAGLPCSLVIVGEGPEEGRITAEIRQLGIRDVELLGKVPYARMVSVYHACDFLVFPTLEDVWGLVVNEALLSGLPAIASKYAGCAEELLPANAIFDPLDEDCFLDAFCRAVDGHIPLPEPGRLLSSKEVAAMIVRDIEGRVGARA